MASFLFCFFFFFGFLFLMPSQAGSVEGSEPSDRWSSSPVTLSQSAFFTSRPFLFPLIALFSKTVSNPGHIFLCRENRGEHVWSIDVTVGFLLQLPESTYTH